MQDLYAKNYETPIKETKGDLNIERCSLFMDWKTQCSKGINSPPKWAAGLMQFQPQLQQGSAQLQTSYPKIYTEGKEGRTANIKLEESHDLIIRLNVSVQ